MQEPNVGTSISQATSNQQFIVDFYCVKIKLVIEVDGNIHNIPENKVYDIGRSQILNDFGITVIRISNEQIIENFENTINEIEKNVKQVLDKTL